MQKRSVVYVVILMCLFQCWWLTCAFADEIVENGDDIDAQFVDNHAENSENTRPLDVHDDAVDDTEKLVESTVSPSAEVTNIEFDGLNRTREEYVRAELSRYIGMRADEIDLRMVETDLQRIGLFDEISVRLKGVGDVAILAVSLKEKWSFIPIPMISYVDEFMGGLFLMDMNAFGLNNKAIVGGFGSKSRIRGMMSFSTPSLVGQSGLSFFMSGAKDETTVHDMDKHVILEYKSINYMLGAKLNYKFTPEIEVGIGTSYQFADNTPKSSYEIVSKRQFSLRSLNLSGSFKYEKSDWNGWFMSSVKAAVTAEMALVNSDIVSPSVTVNLGYQRPIFVDRFRVLVHAAGYYSYNALIPMYKKARIVGVDFLPTRFISPVMVAGGAGAEVGIYRFKWASFSIGAQYQVVYTKRWEADDMVFHHGWSSSVNVNLSKIAFPAFSIGMTQDVSNLRVQFAFGMGMSM